MKIEFPFVRTNSVANWPDEGTEHFFNWKNNSQMTPARAGHWHTSKPQFLGMQVGTLFSDFGWPS